MTRDRISAVDTIGYCNTLQEGATADLLTDRVVYFYLAGPRQDELNHTVYLKDL